MMERLLRNPFYFFAAFILCALTGAGLFAAAQAMVPGASGGAERARVERVVHDYILEHPEILPEAMERLRTREMASAVDTNAQALVRPFAGAWGGNPNGDVTVSVFMDYACGYCRASLPVIDELVRRDRNVRIVYREFPILSEGSVRAARWALAAAEQNKFRAFHDAMFRIGRPSEATIQRAAQEAGLDIARARGVINTQRVQGEIESNHRIAASLGINGTPAWVVGKEVISGAVDANRLAQAVARARTQRRR